MNKMQTLLNEIEEKGWSYQRNFFDMNLIHKLAEQCQLRNDSGNMQSAAIGSGANKTINEGIRSDKISWLTREEKNHHVKTFLNEMNMIKHDFNQNFYMGLSEYECHFALYPEGSFYKAHMDSFKNNNRRKITFITYLNENWQPGDGGELRIHLDEGMRDIQPYAGSVICFMSDSILHEVLISNKPRMSLTGWFLTNDNCVI